MALQVKEFEESDLESEDLKPLLVSVRYFKAQYTHHASEADFYFESLRLNLKMSFD